MIGIGHRGLDRSSRTSGTPPGCPRSLPDGDAKDVITARISFADYELVDGGEGGSPGLRPIRAPRDEPEIQMGGRACSRRARHGGA
jgi:hypothetical protein